MRRSSYLFVALAVLLAALSLPATPVQAGSLVYTGEITPANTADDYPLAMEAGQTIIIQLDCAPGSLLDPYVEVYSSAMARLAFNDDSGVACMSWRGAYLVFTAPATDTYIIRATSYTYATGVTFFGGPDGAYALTITGDFIPGECVPAPLPPGSVVGTFLTDAIAHWSPGKQTEPSVTFITGKTVWVTGVDASASYYQVAYGCNCLWVPVEAMGPNYDKVWNGAPLPTRTMGACSAPVWVAPETPKSAPPVQPPPT